MFQSDVTNLESRVAADQCYLEAPTPPYSLDAHVVLIRLQPSVLCLLASTLPTTSHPQPPDSHSSTNVQSHLLSSTHQAPACVSTCLIPAVHFPGHLNARETLSFPTLGHQLAVITAKSTKTPALCVKSAFLAGHSGTHFSSEHDPTKDLHSGAGCAAHLGLFFVLFLVP